MTPRDIGRSKRVRDAQLTLKLATTATVVRSPLTASSALPDAMEDDDLIVVDDDVPSSVRAPRPGPSGGPPATPASARGAQTPTTGIRSSLRRRNTPPSYAELDDPTYIDNSGRRTRYSGMRNRPQPKLKLKLSEKAAAQAPGMSFLGPFDRELDSDDEDLVFEEQFVLRMPPGEDCERLRKMVAAREVSGDVWFKFKGVFGVERCVARGTSTLMDFEDSRRAVLHVGNNTYSAKLVDLPCIIESHKTLDNKQLFKVADICQVRCMLV